MKIVLSIFVLILIELSSFAQSEIGVIGGGAYSVKKLTYSSRSSISESFNLYSIQIGGYFRSNFSKNNAIEVDLIYSQNRINNIIQNYSLGIPILISQKFSNSSFDLGLNFDIDNGYKFKLLNTNFKDNLKIFGVVAYNQQLSELIKINFRYGYLFYDALYNSNSAYKNYTNITNQFNLGLSYRLSKL